MNRGLTCHDLILLGAQAASLPSVVSVNNLLRTEQGQAEPVEYELRPRSG